MDNEFKDLQRKWEKQKSELEGNSSNFKQLVSKIENNRKKGLSFHYGNIIILSITLIGLFLFFYFVAPVKELLSRIGVGFMMIGILLRTLIEISSSIKAKKINKLDSTLKTTELTISFYKFRKRIHGPITLIIFVFYLAGFYMISPEFSNYFSLWQMILMDVSCFVIITFIYIQIRKGIQNEMTLLLETIQLKKEIIKE
ncbi:hypothetical protein [uncultured Tenacibaculum sp.]|uniref:hypothetical protein n=1 Tax=uncultured Tenacibaculum sp. TaxID=174713 RepID=UPI002609FA6E|nr:hypothetical protein [uncultured Tenacibaculum sp.]